MGRMRTVNAGLQPLPLSCHPTATFAAESSVDFDPLFRRALFIMPSNRRGFAYFLLFIAGLGCVLLAAFGVFAQMVSGIAGGPNHRDSLLHVLFWLLPALSFVAFGIYFFSHRLGVLLSWIIFFGSAVALFVIDMQSCLAGNCTTTNPIKIALGVFFMPHLWILLAIAAALSRSAVLQRNASLPPGDSRPEAI
jgi:hypothetical protein